MGAFFLFPKSGTFIIFVKRKSIESYSTQDFTGILGKAF